MKWLTMALLSALVLVPISSSAQRPFEVLPIGHIASVSDSATTMWGMSGMEIIKIQTGVGGITPIMRTLAMDARTVEILSRAQAPPLRPSDIKVVRHDGRHYLVVRRYLLTEVLPQDARAAGMSVSALANKWAAAARRVLPQVAPIGNRYGV